ncbi:hypothetical protein DFQ30_008993 [Apophysomyces sp. BC1015]|nr:hypothetical protein DFQ30_008993 [Apophysomyces sp. BC1015]KAG0171086.1 hypothetical protein DFQ29_008989 [Apophysomyces sp. BC1021]
MILALVLGEYGTPLTPFSLYLITPQENYFCIEELDSIFCDTPCQFGSIVTKSLLDHKYSDWVCKHHGRHYMAQRGMIEIARQLNLYALAELCKLNCQQLLDGVGEPLLQTLPLQRIVNVRWIQLEMDPVPLDGQEKILHLSSRSSTLSGSVIEKEYVILNDV